MKKKKKIARFFYEKHKPRDFFYKKSVNFNHNFFDLKNEESQLKI